MEQQIDTNIEPENFIQFLKETIYEIIYNTFCLELTSTNDETKTVENIVQFYTVGSYELYIKDLYKRGVIQIEDFNKYQIDIDIIVILSNCCKKVYKPLYKDFVEQIKNHPAVSGMKLIKKTKIPIIQIYLKQYVIDIQFQLDKNSLIKIPEATKTSLELSPNQIEYRLQNYQGIVLLNYLKRFHTELQNPYIQHQYFLIRKEFYNNNLYGQKYGFIASINLLIMFIKVLQSFNIQPQPNIHTNIFFAFFEFYSRWDFSLPIYIQTDIVEQYQNQQKLFSKNEYTLYMNNAELYSPTAYHQTTLYNDTIAILSPHIPIQNTSYNINASSKKILIDFIKTVASNNRFCLEQQILKDQQFLNKKNYYLLTISVPERIIEEETETSEDEDQKIEETTNSDKIIKTTFIEILKIKIKVLIHLLSYRLNVYYDTGCFDENQHKVQFYIGYKDTFYMNIEQDIKLFEKYTGIKGLQYELKEILV